ncbi:MAG: hypothetical protein E6G56_01975 [Actinobacteria bacterium]|nr:MAG: hypothetical protein E6G56_01975 [Actinomycetota bacterium]
MRSPKLAGIAAALAAATAASGCQGSRAIEAPVSEAQRLDESLTAISADCGEAYQVRARGQAGTGSARHELETLVADATARTEPLARIYAHNRYWRYQSEPISQLVADAKARLHECGLGSAAVHLARITHTGESG